MNTFNILLVDDVEENIYALKLMIEDTFKEVNILSALSAQEAVLKIMKYEIDLILSDVQMPEVDGFQLIEYLHGIEQTKDIPVILITGIYNDKTYVQKGYQVGAVDYITKPVDDELLCSKLRVFFKIYEDKKEDKNLILEKDKLLLDQVKINTMINNLDDFSPDIKKALYSFNKAKDLLEEDDAEIDIMNILKNI
ncbi:MAG: response regulator [Campylobacteraceae bacterium]|nr:response regulator [Campylobacteraceae bacterium]